MGIVKIGDLRRRGELRRRYNLSNSPRLGRMVSRPARDIWTDIASRFTPPPAPHPKDMWLAWGGGSNEIVARATSIRCLTIQKGRWATMIALDRRALNRFMGNSPLLRMGIIIDVGDGVRAAVMGSSGILAIWI